MVAVYAPLAIQRSAWSDDFPEIGDPRRFFEINVGDGRPVLGLINWLVFGQIDSIGPLVIPRLLGVLGIACLIMYMARLLQLLEWSPLMALLVACSIGLLPPFHSYAGWAITFSSPWVLLLATWAGVGGLDAIRQRQRPKAVLCFIGLVVAMLTYPPAAMFCWVALGIRFVSLLPPPRRAFSNTCIMGLFVAAAGFVSLTTARLVMIFFGNTGHRFMFVSSLPEFGRKLLWFSTYPPGVAARPFIISSPDNFEAIVTVGPVLLVILVGLYRRQSGSFWTKLLSLSILIVIPVFAMSAHLIARDNQIEYRFMVSIVVLAWIYLVVALEDMFAWAANTRPLNSTSPLFSFLILLPIVCLATVMAWKNVNQVFIQPFEVKERFLVQQLESFDVQQHDTIVVINPPDIWRSRGNLGIYSTISDLAHPWVIEPNLRILIADAHGHGVAPRIRVLEESVSLGANEFELDLRPLAERM